MKTEKLIAIAMAVLLAPRIVAEGGFAGGIIMAGSSRSLLDIMYDQNMYFIGLMDVTEDEKNALYAQVEEARAAYFTLPEGYIQEMDAHPAEGYLAVTEKPTTDDYVAGASVDLAPLADIAAWVRGR